MLSRHQPPPSKPAVELLEESVGLLRQNFPGSLLPYLVGTLPFLSGLLYFWTDMSHSALAFRDVGSRALGVALLFLWMKCWHAVFARRLLAAQSESPAPPWNVRRVLRLIATQTILQPSALFVLPVAALITVPYGWAHAFYQNVSVYGSGDAGSTGEVFTKSRKQAMLWSKQGAVAIMLLWLFTIFVFLNVVAAIFLLPALLKMLLGIETDYSRSELSLLNSTTFAVATAITFLLVNPLTMAAYVLRCFYGDSLRTGLDLRVELRGIARAARSGVALVLLACSLAATVPADLRAVEPSHELAPSVNPQQLDRSLNEVLSRREFLWRMPPEKVVEQQDRGLLADFLTATWDMIGDAYRKIGKWLEGLMDWIRKFFPEGNREGGAGGVSWIFTSQGLLYLLIAAVLCVALVMAWRQIRRRRARGEKAAVTALQLVPDLHEESTTADQLPVEGWLQTAAELMRNGELRLALRALYLATLAALAGRSLLTIAAFKSNRDYQRELGRRARGRTGIIDPFGSSVALFERVWYGRHPATEAQFQELSENFQRISTDASA